MDARKTKYSIKFIIFDYIFPLIYQKVYDSKFSKRFDSLISLFYRILFKSKIITKKFFNLKGISDITSLKEFWIIRIGFIRYRNYLPYIQVDPFFTNLKNCFLAKKPFICSKLDNIPLESESCQIIHINHFFKYFNNLNFKKSVKNWYSKLIPGGKLKIQFEFKDDSKKVDNLKEVLNKNHFKIECIDKYDLEINDCITITAYKCIPVNTETLKIPIRKLEDLTKLLEKNKDFFLDKGKVGILGYDSTKIINNLKNKIITDNKIIHCNSSEDLLKFQSSFFDYFIIINFFEYIDASMMKTACNEIKRIVKPNSEILLIVPEKKYYKTSKTFNLFEKGIVVNMIDDMNFKIKSIYLSTSLNFILTTFYNKTYKPLKKKDVKIALIGNYTLRYSYLMNARWDSQARAIESLGYETLILDIKDHSFEYILNRLQLFKPNILWLGGKLIINFLRKFNTIFRNSEIKILYWIWDIRKPIKFDFKNIIDTMLVTTKNDIPIYQEFFNIRKVFWMPASIMPEIINRNNNIKEIYDIGFAGSLDKTFHGKRTKLIEIIKRNFNIVLFKNIYNNLPEHYSMCKIVFGGSPDKKDHELYSSNRIYVAMACGCCFLTNYFKGLERLAINKKHVLWFNNSEELVSVLRKYLSDDLLREKIKLNAYKLCIEKHNYIDRILNILDLLYDKSDEFYGFIN